MFSVRAEAQEKRVRETEKRASRGAARGRTAGRRRRRWSSKGATSRVGGQAGRRRPSASELEYRPAESSFAGGFVEPCRHPWSITPATVYRERSIPRANKQRHRPLAPLHFLCAASLLVQLWLPCLILSCTSLLLFYRYPLSIVADETTFCSYLMDATREKTRIF